MADIEAVCFDLDNTLCVPRLDDAEIHERLFERVSLEPQFTPADVRSLDPATLPESDSLREFYENMYAALAPGYTSADTAELARVTGDIIDDTDVEFRDGGEALLEDARDRYPVGLLTHGDPEIQAGKLDALGVRDAFETVVVCGPDTPLAGKPDSEPFERVLAELDVSPGATLYVGDSLVGDVGGANAAGMQSAWMPRERSEETPEPEPTFVVESPAELRELL